MGKITYVVLATFFLLVTSTALSSCSNVDMVVVVENTVEVFEEYPKNKPGNKLIATLSKGNKAEVIHVRYSKEFKFYRVRLEDGREGYVMFGDNFRVDLME